MEISRTDRQRDQRERIKKKSGSSASRSATRTDFQSELTRVMETPYTGTIDNLLEELAEREKQFMDNQSLYELARYKKTVQDLLKLIVEKALDNRTLKRSRFNRNAEQSVIDVIDEKLMAMTEAVTRHSKAFDLMKTMEEIRGLILDMVF